MKTLLYGKGNMGKLAVEILNRLRIPYIQGDKESVPRFSEEERKGINVVVCVATSSFTDIKKKLDAMGFDSVIHFYRFIRDFPQVRLDNGWMIPKTIMKPAPILFEGIDKKHWDSFIYFRVSGDDYGMRPTNDRFYIPEIAKIFPLDKRGFLDVRMYPEHHGSTLADIYRRKRVHYYYKKVEYVIIHAEGLELQTLWYNLPYFKQTRPVIAVTVYHSQDGLFAIPELMKKELENYYFHFRCHAFYGQAAVLYAIPYEKMKIA